MQALPVTEMPQGEVMFITSGVDPATEKMVWTPADQMRAIAINLEGFSPVPDRFIQVPPLCCAFTCMNCDFPNCLGAQGYNQCLCLECEAYSMKRLPPPGDARICCVLYQESCGYVSCDTRRCRCYHQHCCWECLCGCPYDEAYTEMQLRISREGRVAPEDVTFYNSFCCCCCGIIDGCFCKCPEMLGCYESSQFLCCYKQVTSCKPLCYDVDRPKQKAQCLLDRRAQYLVQCDGCCKAHSQICCYDRRSACPSDAEVPCVWNMLPCLTCCVNWRCFVQCCPSIKDITDFASTPLQGPSNL